MSRVFHPDFTARTFTAVCIFLAVALICARAASAESAGTAPMPANEAAFADRIAELRALAKANSKDKTIPEELAKTGWQMAAEIERLESMDEYSAADTLAESIQELLQEIYRRTERTAKDGNTDALLALAVMQRRGLLTPQSNEKSCRSYEKLAEQQVLAALFRYAECRIAANDAKALDLLRQAAEAGHGTAQHSYGELLLRQEPAQPEEAARWIYRAARQGRPSSQALLAWMYQKGTGVVKDPEAAAVLYKQSAAQGYVISENNLGEMYETGSGVDRDPTTAARLYESAGEQDFPPAQLNLARLYALGLGVEKDGCAAVRWTERALASGFEPARETAKWLTELGVNCAE